jgi:tetratricopeptide (TPR) repeat protein
VRTFGVLLLLALLTIVRLPAAAPQRSIPLRDPGGPEMATPFSFKQRWAPSGQFKKEQLTIWLAAVERHSPGRADDAAREVAALMPEVLSDVVAVFERQAVKNKDWSERIDLTKRAVVLHTDIALGAARVGRLDELNQSAGASLHLGAALELAGCLQSQKAKIKTRDLFVPTWWRMVAGLLGQTQDPVSSIPFMRRAVALFPDDPEILMMAGAHHELLASPKELVSDETTAGELLRAWRGTEAGNLKEAARCYRAVLEIDPGRVEAHVRLGRVLVQQQHDDAAIGELTPTVGAATTPALEFFRELFLGEAEEGRHDTDAAREAYGRALVLYPGAQSAHLAMARLERTAGNRVAELDAVMTLLTRPTRIEDRRDPWREYFVATSAVRAKEWLEQLRAPFRRPQ